MSVPVEEMQAACSTEMPVANRETVQNQPLDTDPSRETTEAASSAAMNSPGPANQGLDRLMQRMKSDLMFELRNIQHGEKPVTGQNHRDTLHQLMLKHCDGPNTGLNTPANVDNVEEHRPEAVVVEVQGMIERRPVSSVLQSAAFRRQLENVIRGGIISASRTSELSSRPRQHRLDHAARRSQTASAIQPAVETQPALSRSNSTDSIDSFSSARSSADQDLDEDEIEVDSPDASQARVVREEVPRPRASSSTPPLPRPRASVVNRSSPSPLIDTHNDREPGVAWSTVSEIHREELVQEISELLHSRLVSSTLDSEFRATLELQVEQHVLASGENGQAVQDFVRSLPGRGIPRNDFNHLGIPANGPDSDNWDNVSVASVSAHSVPYVQTNTYLGREIQSLRSQMAEMKSMLKLTFDLQMDIQRSIRQEVAAALNNFSGNSSGAACSSNPVHNRPVNDSHCLICLDRHSDTVLYQCGHMCVCYTCGRDLISRGLNCPVCRAPIKDVIRAYRTNAE